MDGVDRADIVVLIEHAADGAEHVAHRLAEIFPAVCRDENEPLPCRPCELRMGIVGADGRFQRVDDRVAGDKNPIGDSLFQEVIFVVHRRAEIEIRNGGNQLAVHFLREGRILVIGSETGLHMAHLHLMVEGGQRPGKGGGGVPVDQHQVGLGLLQY